MQTREENLSDLIQSLQISSAYRQRQEELMREQVIQECVSFSRNGASAKQTQLH